MKLSKRVAVIVAAVIASLAVTGAAISNARRSESARFLVHTSIDGKKKFAHRVHWVAYPNLPPAKILAVEFLIDGKLRWVEHHPSYTYGGLDGDNYLITSWLTPGRHRFQVIALGAGGARAADTVTANVLPSAPPPSALAGTWTASRSAGGAPAGTWTLTVDNVGWRLTDPDHGGNLIDPLYRSDGEMTLRTGIWTHPHNTREGNGWCEDTNVPVSFHWSISGNMLTLAREGADGCGESDIVDGTWRRK